MDPVRFNLIVRALESIPSEMSINMLKAAYSSIVREAKDLSTALFDPEGNAVVQAEQIPILVAALSSALGYVIEKHPLDSWEADDCIITNDPYHGGQHLNDIALFAPIFKGKKRVGIAGSIAHHLDLGGIEPGIIGSATEIFHDGLLFPRIKFKLLDGKLDPIIEQILKSNVRVPRETYGDLQAQIVANRTAESRLLAIMKKFGILDVFDVMKGLQDYSEKLTRKEIDSFPNGEWSGEAKIDDDSQGNGPFTVRVNVKIKDSDLFVDYRNSDEKAKGTINCPYASTLAATYTAIRQVVNTRVYVPANDGSTRPIIVDAPLGSIVNPTPPASVHARFITAYRCYEAVMDALSKAVPNRTTAVGFNSTFCLALSQITEDGYKIMSETTAGGWGAGPKNDGADALPLPLSNCSNVPAEWIENQFPYLRVTRYEMINDSCGHGRQRGGLGELKEYEILMDGINYSGMCDRFIHPAKGILGGTDSAKGELKIIRKGKEINLPSKTSFALKKGDLVRIITGGGGGYGSPNKRKIELLKRDIKQGIISKKIARKIYNFDYDKHIK